MLIIYYSANIAVERYLSPVSGKRTTIFLPLFSFLCANLIVAFKAAPLEISTNKPSIQALFLPILKVSS